MTQEQNEDAFYVVLHLHRWDRTDIQLSLKERLTLLFKSKFNLADMLGFDSIGWVPVFGTQATAEGYRDDEAPDASIAQIQRHLQE